MYVVQVFFYYFVKMKKRYVHVMLSQQNLFLNENIQSNPVVFGCCFEGFKGPKQTWTRVSNLEKSREILTSLAPSRSKKLNFHSLSLLHFQDFEEKILFLFSIYENLKHKSRSLLDLDLEFSSGSVCVWN